MSLSNLHNFFFLKKIIKLFWLPINTSEVGSTKILFLLFKVAQIILSIVCTQNCFLFFFPIQQLSRRNTIKIFPLLTVFDGWPVFLFNPDIFEVDVSIRQQESHRFSESLNIEIDDFVLRHLLYREKMKKIWNFFINLLKFLKNVMIFVLQDLRFLKFLFKSQQHCHNIAIKFLEELTTDKRCKAQNKIFNWKERRVEADWKQKPETWKNIHFWVRVGGCRQFLYNNKVMGETVAHYFAGVSHHTLILIENTLLLWIFMKRGNKKSCSNSRSLN